MKKTLLLTLLVSSFCVFSQEVSVFRTTANGSERLTPQNSFELNDYTLNNPNIVIEEGQYRQTMDGFGYTLTNGSAEVFMTLNATKRDEVLNELFNPITGINSSMVRIPIGSCDLASSLYTYNDNSGDTDMSEFNFGPDANHLIPILKQIKKINPNIKLLATPWSAPKWMKTQDKWNGGRLRGDKMATYALYLKTYLEKMDEEGLTIWGLSIQNEPLNSNNHPAMYMSSDDQINFINNHLESQIQSLTISKPKIIAYDHNCDDTNYPIAVANACNLVDGTAFHLYDSEHRIEAMSDVYNATNKNVYFTEQYTGGYSSFNGDFGFHIEKVVLGSIQNWSRTVFTWNMTSDANFGPTTSPDVCDDCQGAVTVNNGNYSKKVAYYIIGQVSKFVDPGARVITTSGSNNNDYKFKAAFANPDGTKVLIFWNNNSGYERDIDVNIGDKSFSYRIPKRSAITFKWRDGAAVTPNTPTGLIAKGENGLVDLSWTPSDGATSYNVLRSTSQNGNYTVLESNILNVSYTDTQVNENTTYYYKVTASNSAGTSNSSTVVSVTISPFEQLVENGIYRITSDIHNEYITAPNTATNNVYMESLNEGNTKQNWEITHIENNIYTFKNSNTGKYLGIKDNWCGVLAEVVANYNETDDNIEFKIVSSNTGKYSFQLALTNCNFGSENSPIKVWDIEYGASGAPIRTYTEDGTSANQIFKLESVITGIGNTFGNNDLLSVYPSPSKGTVTIKHINAEYLEGLLTLLNVNGHILKTMEANTTTNSITLDISEFNSGVYYLQLTNDTQSITKKVVLSKN